MEIIGWKCFGSSRAQPDVAFAGRQDDARAVLRELEQYSAEKYVSPYLSPLPSLHLANTSWFAHLEDGLRFRFHEQSGVTWIRVLTCWFPTPARDPSARQIGLPQ